MTHFSLIAAVGENLELGGNRALLWTLPRDLQHFKTLTLDHTVIMGRSTWDSLPLRPLPRRRNIVISHHPLATQAAEQATSLEHALALAAQETETFVIGGAQIYRLFLPLAETIYLTRLHGAFPNADTFFPEFSSRQWKLFEDFFVEKDTENVFDINFQIYKKIYNI